MSKKKNLPQICDNFLQTCLIWTSNLSFSSTSNPKYFATCVLLILSPRIFKENLSILIVFGEKSIKLVLDVFRVNLFEVNHSSIILASLFAALFNFSELLSLIIITVSSANNLTLNSKILGKSLTYKENKVGPRIEP